MLRVIDTQKKLGDLIVHTGIVESGSFKTGDAVELTVDHARRSATRANHSATHLIHEALRQVLGTHVAQKGSLVAPERLRFDISHPKPMSAEEIKAVEDLANAIVLQNAPVETRLMALEDAMQTGAMALFGEKYGDEVRVVSMGSAKRRQSQQGLERRAVRRHACAAHRRHRPYPHCRRERIGGWRAAHRGPDGGRRAGAPGRAGRAHARACGPDADAAGGCGRARQGVARGEKGLEKQLADAKRQAALGAGSTNGTAGATAIRTIGNVKLLARTVQGLNPKDLRGLVDDGKKQVGSGVVAIVGVTEDGKAGLAVGVTDDLTTSLSAVDLVKAGAEALGGKGGGGRPDMAQAGGPDGTKADAALKAIEAKLG